MPLFSRTTNRMRPISHDDAEGENSVVSHTRPLGPVHDRERARRRLYDDVGEFLLAHDLSITPLNFGLAHDYLARTNRAVELEIDAITKSDDPLSDAVMLEISQRTNLVPTAEALLDMLKKAQEGVNVLDGLATASRISVHMYGDALRADINQAERGKEVKPLVSKLLELTSSMVSRTDKLQNEMDQNQSEISRLKSKLDAAQRAANKDALTNLPNRRAFDAQLEHEASKAFADGGQLVLAICDIDHFKSINDTHGHDTGDRVLQFVANQLKQNCRRCFVARIGGEEFGILLPGHSVPDAMVKLDAARQNLSERNIVNRRTERAIGRVTFSAGLADRLNYVDGSTALKAADEALYLAKRTGRDRVCAASFVPRSSIAE